MSLNTFSRAAANSCRLLAHCKPCWCFVALILVLLYLQTLDYSDISPRFTKLEPFNPPRVPAFTCIKEDSVAPAPDLQAAALFREAERIRALPRNKRDMAKADQLTQQASKRSYWPAMLEQAREYRVFADRPRDVERALKLLERGIRLRIPDAYYQMGLFYFHGAGVPLSRGRAYAFWQKAAYMGNPVAMTELAKVMSTKQNNTIGNGLVNLPVATAMLNCALRQGYGDAAEFLARIVEIPKADDGTVLGASTELSTARSLRILQDGVKLGCGPCANTLSLHFRFSPADSDADRSDLRVQFYALLSNQLLQDDALRFPHLDAAMPLPPAPMPASAADFSLSFAIATGEPFGSKSQAEAGVDAVGER